MVDKHQQKIWFGCCVAAYAVLALVCLVMHFSIAGLMITIGAVAITIGAFAGVLDILLPCGFAFTALAYIVEFVWYMIQTFSMGFRWFFLLFPILECLLMIAVFAVLFMLCVKPDKSRTWGIAVSAASFVTMLLVVATAFAGYFTGNGQVNYIVYLQRLILIPVGFLFGCAVEGEDPLLVIDLKKEEKEQEGDGQVIGYTPEVPERRTRRSAKNQGEQETDESTEYAIPESDQNVTDDPDGSET